MTTQQMSDLDQSIAAAALRTRQARGDFAGHLDRLNGELAGIGGQWQGTGAAAFTRVTGAWNDQVARLLVALDGFADSLDNADLGFQSANDDAARSLDQLASRLG